MSPVCVQDQSSFSHDCGVKSHCRRIHEVGSDPGHTRPLSTYIAGSNESDVPCLEGEVHSMLPTYSQDIPVLHHTVGEGGIEGMSQTEMSRMGCECIVDVQVAVD